MVKIVGPDRIIIAKKEKKKLRIFCDLDSVCSYWEESAASVCDIDFKNEEIREQLKNGVCIENLVGGKKKMWKLIDDAGENFWKS